MPTATAAIVQCRVQAGCSPAPDKLQFRARAESSQIAASCPCNRRIAAETQPMGWPVDANFSRLQFRNIGFRPERIATPPKLFHHSAGAAAIRKSFEAAPARAVNGFEIIAAPID